MNANEHEFLLASRKQIPAFDPCFVDGEYGILPKHTQLNKERMP